MRMFVPEIGTVFTLAEPWTFKVVNETRNRGLADLMGVKGGDYYFPFGTKENDEYGGSRYYGRRIPKEAGEYTFPAGTSLEVDRIYVRKGNEDFSSLTFKTRVNGKVLRFFAKLEDVNKIEF
jgi:hypothetical protein